MTVEEWAQKFAGNDSAECALQMWVDCERTNDSGITEWSISDVTSAIEAIRLPGYSPATELSQARARIAELEKASADDIRALGWSVAVHNDYRLAGDAWTFWLFTKDGTAIKGEGRTDAEALNLVRAAIKEHP